MRRSPVQARSRATVVHILGAAAAEIDERGYDATTTTGIAERAGISVGSLYQYFPNKQALLVALADHHVREARVRCAELFSGCDDLDSTERIVRRVVEAAIALHGPDTRLHRAMFHRVVRTDALEARVRDLQDALEGAVRDLLLRLGVSPAAAPLGARSLVTMVSVLLHDVMLADDLDGPSDDRVAVAVDACMGVVDGLIRRSA